MGTNYYARRIPTMKEAGIIVDNVIKYITVESQDTDFLKGVSSLEEVHLGKRSCGWQFLWQTSTRYDTTLKSIKEYLSRPDIIIYDEYGEKFTVEQFFKEEIGKSLYNDPENYINGEQYNKLDPSPWYRRDSEWTTGEGLRFTNDDFS